MHVLLPVAYACANCMDCGCLLLSVLLPLLHSQTAFSCQHQGIEAERDRIPSRIVIKG